MGAGVARRGAHRFGAARAVVEFADRFRRREREEEALRGIDVVIFEVEALQPRVLPGQALGLAERFEQPFLRNPIDAAEQQLRFGAERVEGEGPALEDPIGLLVAPARWRCACARNSYWMSSASRVRPSSSCTTPRAGAFVGNLARGDDGIAQDDVVGQAAFLEQGEHERGRAEFQRRRKGAHVRVADEQMQPPIFAVVRERLVARIDDRAVELHPLIDVVDDVIGPLAELEIDRGRALRAARNRTPADWPARRGPRR